MAIFIKYTHNYLQNFPELDLLPKSTLKTNLKTDPISTKTKHFWLFSPKLLKKSLTPKPNETILITFQKSQNFPPCECVCKRERSYIGYNSAARVARVSCRWAVFQLGESSWLTHHPSLETCVSEWSLQHIKKTMKLWQNSDIFKSISTRGCEIMPDLKESERTFVMPENEANPGGATRYAQCFLTLKYFWSRLLTRCFCEKLTKSAILRWKYFFFLWYERLVLLLLSQNWSKWSWRAQNWLKLESFESKPFWLTFYYVVFLSFCSTLSICTSSLFVYGFIGLKCINPRLEILTILKADFEANFRDNFCRYSSISYLNIHQ